MPVTETADNRRIGRESSLIRIVKDLRDDALSLIRQEVALAKSEIGRKAFLAGRNVAFLAVGVLLGLYGLFFVLLSLNNLLFAGLAAAGFSGSVSNWFAPGLLGMGLFIGALLLTLKALKGMRKAAQAPEKTMATLRDDKDWIKGKIR